MSHVDPIPAGPRLLPSLSVHDGKAALAFYERAFGATVTLRLDMPDGRLGHAELAFADGVAFQLADEWPDLDFVSPRTRGGTSVTLSVYVADVDAIVARAVEAGATLTRPISNEFYGDRVGQIVDPFGHRWSFHTRIEEVDEAQMRERMNAM